MAAVDAPGSDGVGHRLKKSHKSRCEVQENGQLRGDAESYGCGRDDVRKCGGGLRRMGKQILALRRKEDCLLQGSGKVQACPFNFFTSCF